MGQRFQHAETSAEPWRESGSVATYARSQAARVGTVGSPSGRRLISVLVVLGWLLPASLLWADGRRLASLRGKLLAPVAPNTVAELVPMEGDARGLSARVLSDGSFQFSAVPAASYVLRVGRAQRILRLEPGEFRHLELTLDTEVREELLVRAAPTPRSDPDVLELGSARSIAASGRTVQSMVEMLPGLVHDASSRYGGDRAPAIDGGLPHELVSLVDGIDTSFPRSGGRLRLFLPRAAVDEVRVRRHGLSAAYGRGTSGVLELTIRAGGNQWRGEALAVLQAPGWRSAARALPQPSRPASSRLEMRHELTLGGPLFGERSWFFAAAARTSTNRPDVLAGEVFDAGFDVSSRLLKTTLALGSDQRHRLDLMAIDAPVERLFARPGSGDVLTACRCDEEERLFSLHLSTRLAESWGIETKLGSRRERTSRSPSAQRIDRPLDPAASPDDPDGNRALYFDRASGLRYNGLAITGGEGWQLLPREQASVIGSWLHRRGETRGGIDHQETEFRARNSRGAEYQGEGFDRALPGGFVRPQFVRVYDSGAAGCCLARGRYQALHVQRRVSFVRASLEIGLRADRQVIGNDLGERALSATDIVPRVAAALDLRNDGRLVLRAHVGRSTQAVPLELAIREFSRLPTGANQFTEFGWNRSSGRYDRFRRRSVPTAGARIALLEPYYRDEIGVGLAWRPVQSSDWWLDSRMSWWQVDDLFWSTDQFDERGRVVRDIRNWAHGFRRAQVFSQTFGGSVAEGLSIRGDVTWTRTLGNMFALDDDSLFEGLGGVVSGSARAIDANHDLWATHRGRSPFEREWSSNLDLVRTLRLGTTNLSLAAGMRYRSGARWARTANVDLVHPSSGARIRSMRFLEERGRRQLDDLAWIDVAAHLELPPLGTPRSVRPTVGLEVSNLGDEQEVIGINSSTGRPLPGLRGFQAPREVRWMLGLEF